jgi:hypothetical protein
MSKQWKKETQVVALIFRTQFEGLFAGWAGSINSVNPCFWTSYHVF